MVRANWNHLRVDDSLEVCFGGGGNRTSFATMENGFNQAVEKVLTNL